MATIANQSNIVIVTPNEYSFHDEEAKQKLRRAFLRGTLYDYIVRFDDMPATGKTYNEGRVVSHQYYEDGETGVGYLVVFAHSGMELKQLDCGEIKPEDYTDEMSNN